MSSLFRPSNKKPPKVLSQSQANGRMYNPPLLPEMGGMKTSSSPTSSINSLKKPGDTR